MQQSEGPSLGYYLDIGNSAIHGTPVAFTSKYSWLQNYRTVLGDQDRMVALVYRIIAQEATGQFDLASLIAEAGFQEGSSSVVGQVIKAKYAEYKRELIKRELYQGGKHLRGFNWRVKSVLGCNSFSHKNRVVLKLQLHLAQGKMSRPAEVVSLELSVSQARELLNKLKQVAKEMKQ